MAINSVRAVLGAAALAIMAPSANAAIIKTGSYDAGFFSDTAGLTLGPGRYEFSITLTTPVDFVDGYAEKQTVYNEFCIDPDVGPEEFFCGGNDVPTQPLWDQVTLTLYRAALTVDPPRAGPLSGGFAVRFTEEDFCCTFQYGWDAPGRGSYILAFRTVPEPATWAAMVVGFALLGSAARKRRVRLALRPTF